MEQKAEAEEESGLEGTPSVFNLHEELTKTGWGALAKPLGPADSYKIQIWRIIRSWEEWGAGK